VKGLKRIKRGQVLFFLSLLLTVIFSIKFFPLRKLGYQEIPVTTDILDEKNYIWAAKSFLQTGIPAAWSNLDAYQPLKKRENIGFDGLSLTSKNQKPSFDNRGDFDYPITAITEVDVGKGKEQILIVQPFFDHSFFSGIIFGLKTSNNLSNFEKVNPEDYRLIAIYVSIFTGFLIFLLSYLLYGPFVSIISFLIYSSANIYLLVSRYALIENILVPLSLLTILFLLLYKKTLFKRSYQKRLLLILSGISAGLALTTKELGIASVLTGILILLNYKASKKEILHFLISAVLFGSIFYVYAFIVSPKLFFEIFINQVNRGFFGSLNFIHSFYRPHFNGFPLEGWWVFGFICLIFLISDFKKHFEVAAGFVSYLFVFLFFSGLNHPWYSLTLVPYMVIASGVFIYEMLKELSILKIALFFLFPFSSTFYWGYNVFHDQKVNVLIYRIFLLLFLGLITFCFLGKEKRKLHSRSKLKICLSVILFLIVFKVFQWNQYGWTYIIANWGKLPFSF